MIQTLHSAVVPTYSPTSNSPTGSFSHPFPRRRCFLADQVKQDPTLGDVETPRNKIYPLERMVKIRKCVEIFLPRFLVTSQKNDEPKNSCSTMNKKL